MLLFECVLVIMAATEVALGLPGGPPVSACGTISPSTMMHGAAAQSGNGGFEIATDLMLSGQNYNYSGGVTYWVQVRNVDQSVTMRGFMVQAVDPSGQMIGQFMPTGDNQALVNCPQNAMATIGHSNAARADFSFVTVGWIAPTGTGLVNFRFAVVKVRMMYYANQSAAEIAAARSEPLDIIPMATTDSMDTAPTDPQGGAYINTFAFVLLAMCYAVSTFIM